MTGREFLLQTLRSQGLVHVFLVPGGHIDPLVAELGKGVGLQPIVAAHEEGAGFMADGYARVSGRFGTCLCIGGPGAANVLPAAIAARSDRARVLFITGDVPTTLQGRGAFQDGSLDGTRDSEFLRPATVYSEEVELASQLPRQMAAAFRAMFGVPSGPAHLSVPTDIQNASLGAEAGVCPALGRDRVLSDDRGPGEWLRVPVARGDERSLQRAGSAWWNTVTVPRSWGEV